MSVAEIEEGVFESTATIDNGSLGTRTIRFETAGWPNRPPARRRISRRRDQTAERHHRQQDPERPFRLLPFTIDVEERMYAAGRIPGSFFRREGRPSTDAT